MVRVADHLVVDSDVDLHDPRQRAELRPHSWPVLAAISAGGALGALARYGIGVAFPPRPGGFPWATFGINVSGCLLIGVLMVLIARRWPRARLVRPFAGVGVLGGYTTFSTYVAEIRMAVADGHPGIALVYLAGTLVAAVLAVWVGMAVTQRVFR
jgi:fluoride exporter